MQSCRFPYDNHLLDKAKTLYVQMNTHHIIPIMFICGLSLLPMILLNHRTSDVVAACMMFIGALTLIQIGKQHSSQVTSALYKADTDGLIGSFNMDDRFVSLSIEKGPNTLDNISFLMDEMTDAAASSHTVILCFRDQTILPVYCKDINQAKEILKIAKDKLKTLPGTSIGSLYQIGGGCLILFTILNILSLIAYLVS